MYHLGIFIEPNEKLGLLIYKLKKEINKLDIESELTTHPPHLTLIHGLYENKESVLNKFKNFTFEEFIIYTRNFFYFDNDPNTGLDTLVIKVKKNKKIIDIFDNILLEFKPDEDKLFKNYKKDKNFHRNLINNNYPFDAQIWIPHFSIASYDSKNKIMVEEIINKYKIVNLISIKSLSLWEIDGNNHNKIYSIENTKESR